jgi:hypothetical protein
VLITISGRGSWIRTNDLQSPKPKTLQKQKKAEVV